MVETVGKSGRSPWPRPTFAVKFAVLLLIFLVVPAILYDQFRVANAEKDELLLANVRQQGRLIAESLRPLLGVFKPATTAAITERLAGVGEGSEISIKVLLRPPGETGADNFFFVAAWPTVSPKYLVAERDSLIRTGVFDKVRDTCKGNLPLTLRYSNPQGAEELLASLAPVNIATGCWVIITSYRTDSFLRSSLGRPYWRTPEVQFAAVIYLIMAAAVVWLFVNAWRNLRRFERLARRIGDDSLQKTSFRRLNRLPELDGVAVEFDRMVMALRDSARIIRQAAEDNAHALKAPVAVISQATEPIKRSLPADDERGRRAVVLIEESVERLDALVSAARRLDEATAEVIERGQERVNLTDLLEHLLDGYQMTWQSSSLTIDRRIAKNAIVLAAADILETVFENVLENAASFSPDGGRILVSVRRVDGDLEARVEDQGPGVPEHKLARIFERYVSERPPASTDDVTRHGGPHFGIGLWVARRNVEALGGSIHAENRDESGLRVVIRLPAAS